MYIYRYIDILEAAIERKHAENELGRSATYILYTKLLPSLERVQFEALPTVLLHVNLPLLYKLEPPPICLKPKASTGAIRIYTEPAENDLKVERTRVNGFVPKIISEKKSK